MQLVALHVETEERIDITEYERPRDLFSFGDLICPMPDCHGLLMIKDGDIIARHLAHQTLCRTSWHTKPKSPEHLATQYWLKENLNRFFTEYTSAEFKLEVQIPEVRRVADVMAVFPLGMRIAHEVQLSNITVKELGSGRMTIEKLESMSGGGLESKMSSHQQFEIGAVIMGSSLEYSVLRPNLNLKISATEFNTGLEIEVVDYMENHWHTEPNGQFTLQHGCFHPVSEERVSWLLQGEFIDTAIIRYFELWGYLPVRSSKFQSGMTGTEKLMRSFASRLGGLHSKPGRIKKLRQRWIGKWPEWEWQVLDFSEIYRDVFRLSQDAIKIAREFAFRLKAQTDRKAV